jgi:DNA-binding SARP family transcriptional activator
MAHEHLTRAAPARRRAARSAPDRRSPPYADRNIDGTVAPLDGSVEMEFRLLGPLEVADSGRLLALGGTRQRSLLAILLLHANQVLSAERLIDDIWPDAPPATGAKTLHVYVSRLRKELGGERLVTRPPGYALQVDRSELDLARFEQLLGEARAAAAGTAAGKLREALALWRGPALADLAYETFAQPHIARLEELRLVALEQRVEADLAAGSHAELVGELEALVADNPLRERLRRQLMLALYRSGRQAEALDVYQQTRRTLADELGLEPGEELKRLEVAILNHDPALDGHGGSSERSIPAAETADRSLLVAPSDLDGLPALLSVAAPLSGAEPRRELIIAAVVPTADLGDATRALGARRDDLLAAGLSARTAAFSSPTPGDDIVRLARQQDVDLLVIDRGRPELDPATRLILEGAPCDVALLVGSGGALRPGPVVVPFGAGEHDWAALELGAWIARSTGAALRLIGAAWDGHDEGRDASRLLADASLIVQHTAGVLAEPLLASPGRRGVVALAAGAGLLVVGLSERWRQEGLGSVRARIAASPPSPTVFVRRGLRPGGLAPAETRTRFSWSMTATMR